MKKLIVLSVLLVLAGFPLLASDVTFGGDASYGFIASKQFGEGVDATMDLTAVVDDYVTVNISTDWDSWTLDKAVAVYDLAGATGLADFGVGVSLTAGKDDPADNAFQVISGYENEDVFDFDPIEYWGFSLLITAMDMVNIHVAIDPSSGAAEPGRFLGGIYVEDIAGISAEVYYFQGESEYNKFDQGQIAFDAAYSTAFGVIGLDAGAGFVYDMSDAAKTAKTTWAYGVGLGFSYTEMVSLGVGVDGNETDAFEEVTANVMVNPIDMLSVYAGMDLDIAKVSGETLKGIDFGLNLHVGAGEVYVGYLVTTVGDGKWKAPAAPLDGGFYIETDIDY